MRRVAAAGVYHIFHIQRVAVFVHQFMRTEKLQRLTALLTFMHHGFIADIGRCFLLTGRQHATALPAIRNASSIISDTTSRRTTYAPANRNEFIGHGFTAVSFPAELLKRRRDDIQSQGFRCHLFPCLADFFWLNVIGGIQITTSCIKDTCSYAQRQG